MASSEKKKYNKDLDTAFTAAVNTPSWAMIDPVIQYRPRLH